MISDNSIDDKENQYNSKTVPIDLTNESPRSNHQLNPSIHNRNQYNPSIDRESSTPNDVVEVVEVIDDEDDDDADGDYGSEDLNTNGDVHTHEDYNQHPQPVKNDKIKPSLPSATEFKALSDKLMKPLDDYPVSDEAHDVWEIKSWSNLADSKIRGPRFKCGNFEWNILLFPRGNSNNNTISIYIEPHPLDPSINEKDDDWYVCAQFGFDLWNPNHPNSHSALSSFHRFNKNDADWGFSSFVDLHHMTLPNKNGLPPILSNNQINITAYVKVIDDSQTGVLWYNFHDYDSKKATGYVGLNNQGATCYLNSLLQSYYTTKIFRKLVYQIPTTSNTIIKSNKKVKKESSVALSLQKVFYLLSSSQNPVGTLELTKSFGWDSSDAFTQHDVQELNRILMDKLETSMKNTPIENKLNDLFVGKMKSFIKCINVPYESSRIEDFWDIQLNVKGLDNLQSAFENYIEIEMLNEDNKYQAGDEYGYQDAKKGVVFQHFPPILHLQLKRFEYDFQIDDLSKINDRYEFPDQIDLSPYLDEDLSPEIRNENWNYKLHGVLVHQGSISNGHYYTMIKPNAKDNQWYRFEDDRVWKVTPTEAFQANFGCDEITEMEYVKMSRQEQSDYIIKRSTSAYMLVYYRETFLNDILPENDEEINNQIPKFIPIEIENQLNEAKMLESLKQQQLYNINLKLVTLEMFQQYNHFDLYHDPLDQKFYDKHLVHGNIKLLEFSFKKTDEIFVLYNKINESKGLGLVQTIEDIGKLPYRLLLITHRNNHTNRADGVLNLEGLDNLSLSNIYANFYTKRHDEMVFFIDEGKDLSCLDKKYESSTIEDFKIDEIDARIDSIVPSLKSLDDHIMIFLKLFNPITDKMHGLGYVTVTKDKPIKSIIPIMNSLTGIDCDFDMFEELTPYKLEAVDPTNSFEVNELNSGDIIVLQFKDYPSKGKFKTLHDYYKFLATRLHIKVSPYNEDFSLNDDDDEYNEDLDIKDDFIDVSKDDEMVVLNKDGEPENVFDLWVSTLNSCEDLSKEISKHIGVDYQYIRLFIVNQQGMKFPIKTSAVLSQYFPKNLSISEIVKFEYDILKISLKEFESMKTFKIHWITKIFESKEFEIMISINDSVEGLIKKLQKELESEGIKINVSNLLMWYGNDCKYVGFIRFDGVVSELNETFDFYVGEFPVELNVFINHDLMNVAKPTIQFQDDKILQYEYEQTEKFKSSLNIVPVFHFYKSSSNHHSIPFLFIILPEEKFIDTKKRLQYKLGLSDVHFSKIKFALADNSEKGRYLDDNEDLILYDQIENGLSLALDHIDRSPRKNIFDKGIQIK
ncbi:ubiquitin carboxyl-terminal hydrolase 15 [[Candida] jaroonii]|uniref:Ubiquitin carboxyl-terminal hydrolase 15 n=1 Tax=[Candida] jaroonii TaxID=467808 RepID=A0ACA9Y364_9ASCO|nr:ubiquitin carboxyl-terminal hydrolase 15 [[Candida] jaroonii]